MKKAIIILLLPLGLMFTRCELINPAEDIPAYIHVDTVMLNTDPAAEGSAAHSIVDAWVVTSGDIIGTFELPATIPVLKTGADSITFRAGIKINGISNTRTFYPFYAPYTIFHNFEPAKIDTIKPVVEYLNSTVFSLVEDFEGLSSRFDTSGLSKVGFELTDDQAEVFEGRQSLKVTLHDTADAFELVSKAGYMLPRNTPVFAELNYKTESVFYVGLIATGSNLYYKSSVIGINPSTEWKKIYINLSGLVTSLVQPNLAFRVFISGELDEDKKKSVILLDNFKLLH